MSTVFNKIDKESTIVWTTKTVPTSSKNYNGLAYASGTYVAIAAGTNGIMYSLDECETWQDENISSDNWTSLTYGSGTFLAVSNNGTERVAMSPDGINWTIQNSNLSTSVGAYWSGVAYGQNMFAAISLFDSDGIIATSVDGIDWTNVYSGSGYGYNLYYFNDTFFAINNYGGIIRSSDGINWVTSSASGYGGTASDLTYGDGKYVIMGSTPSEGIPTLYTVITGSSDATTWRTGSVVPDYSFNNTITYGNGVFVALGSNTGLVSTDGLEWQRITIPNRTWSDIDYINNKFIAVGYGAVMIGEFPTTILN